jgi:hypothetical protein
MNNIDVLNFMLPSPHFQKMYHLASSQQGVNPIYCCSRPVDSKSGWLYYIKSNAGNPWDINFYDENYIYQCVTEKDWDDATSYKQFSSSSWPGGHGGVCWSPRYVAPHNTNFLVSQDSSYKTFKGCGNLVDTQDLGGPTVCFLQGPFRERIGCLNEQTVILQSYQWGRNLANLEQNTYAEGLGWVRWRLYALKKGLYELEQESLFDMQTTGGTPEPNFPCDLP